MGSNEKKRRKNIVQVAILLVVVAAGYVLFNVVSGVAERSSLLKLSFKSPSGLESKPFFLTIASAPSSRKIGLMYKNQLAPDRGMLFVFPDEEHRSFWMKNTYVSLDIIFLDHDLKVQGIVPNAPILTEARQEVVDIKSMFVIELPAGTTQKMGIGVGSVAVPYGPIPRGIPEAVEADPKRS